jgi:phospholipid/cholesterol/gamma-HCH transport system permease protein
LKRSHLSRCVHASAAPTIASPTPTAQQHPSPEERRNGAPTRYTDRALATNPTDGAANGDDSQSLAAQVGAAFFAISEQLGGVGVLTAKLARRLFPPRLDGPELWRNLHKMGVRSVPIVAVTALFTGAIMVIQAGVLIKRFGAEGLLGWGAGFATLREVGPILIALMFSGRVGANNTAELGTMKVTEQLDALSTLAIDPLSYLVLPRVISMVITLFVLTIFGDVLALVGAAVTGQGLLGVSTMTFYNGFIETIRLWDLATGLIKSGFFGLVIALSSCHFGLTVTGGAPGVGRAVNASVVASASGVFVVDYFSTYLLQ